MICLMLALGLGLTASVAAYDCRFDKKTGEYYAYDPEDDNSNVSKKGSTCGDVTKMFVCVVGEGILVAGLAFATVAFSNWMSCKAHNNMFFTSVFGGPKILSSVSNGVITNAERGSHTYKLFDFIRELKAGTKSIFSIGC
ncbi:MAG: hypothetical protein LBB37_04035 [Endomicrobium sp.]|jgi:hypothetical protein|nr:hypothetical protein [Endomicrobium sp.]MDR2818589.1 hypothetical protein [Endomicrobium sp.]